MHLERLRTEQMNEILARMSKDIPIRSIAYQQRTTVMRKRLIKAWNQRVFGGKYEA